MEEGTEAVAWIALIVAVASLLWQIVKEIISWRRARPRLTVQCMALPVEEPSGDQVECIHVIVQNSGAAPVTVVEVGVEYGTSPRARGTPREGYILVKVIPGTDPQLPLRLEPHDAPYVGPIHTRGLRQSLPVHGWPITKGRPYAVTGGGQVTYGSWAHRPDADNDMLPVGPGKGLNFP